jgi:hypothetical protein
MIYIVAYWDHHEGYSIVAPYTCPIAATTAAQSLANDDRYGEHVGVLTMTEGSTDKQWVRVKAEQPPLAERMELPPFQFQVDRVLRSTASLSEAHDGASHRVACRRFNRATRYTARRQLQQFVR